VRHWEEHFAPLFAEQLKAERKGQATKRWEMDETVLKVAGKYQYLYRCIDNEGRLVEVRLSPVRDQAATDAFFEQAVETVDHKPEQVTTDGEQSYPKAIDKILGCSVEHRINRYANNRLEQDHRGVKERYYPMLGFKSFESASRFSRPSRSSANNFGSAATISIKSVCFYGGYTSWANSSNLRKSS
jgi:transposase-like protein